ncbi:hypothetical protein M5K25_017031 [Dendrobium thyrsiflorum]|uniref:PB1 domain-containing protein n=1 Tax=Dendrobium thyrsiflorum TaxID=117978 RepID=A0ABD0ULC5_DENTH
MTYGYQKEELLTFPPSHWIDAGRDLLPVFFFFFLLTVLFRHIGAAKMNCNNLFSIVFKCGGYWVVVKGQSRMKYVGGSQKTLKFERGDINLLILKEQTESLCRWLQGQAYELHYHLNGTSPKVYMSINNDRDVMDMLRCSCNENKVEVVVIVKDFDENISNAYNIQYGDMQDLSEISRVEEIYHISPELLYYLSSLTCKWSKAIFSKHIKNHYNTNNMAESFNSWIEEARNKPVEEANGSLTLLATMNWIRNEKKKIHSHFKHNNFLEVDKLDMPTIKLPYEKTLETRIQHNQIKERGMASQMHQSMFEKASKLLGNGCRIVRTLFYCLPKQLVQSHIDEDIDRHYRHFYRRVSINKNLKFKIINPLIYAY